MALMVVERACDIISDRVASGRFGANEHLTEEIGVGRGAVREAINKPAGDGLSDPPAAERINEPGVRERVLDLLDEVDSLETSMDREMFVEHDASFHAGLMDLSANEIMSREWQRLRRSHFRIAFLHSLTEEEVRTSLAQHREILLTILAGEADPAAELGREPVRLTSGRVQRLSNMAFEAIFSPRKIIDTAKSAPTPG